jgi:hypothetical protein
VRGVALVLADMLDLRGVGGQAEDQSNQGRPYEEATGVVTRL